MVTLLDPRQVGPFEKLILSHAVQREALTGLLVDKKILTEEEFLEMVKTVNLEMKKKRESKILRLVYNADGR